MTFLSRRRLLRRTVAGAAAASSGALAGCSGILSSDDASDTGTALAPEREPTYRQWFPSPEVPENGLDFVGYWYLDVRALAAHEDRLPEPLYRWLANLRGGQDALGISFEDIDAVIDPMPLWISVVVGSYDADAVIETLLGTGYEESGTRGDFALFEGSLGQRAAVKDGAVVWQHEFADDDLLDAVVDARRGEVQRLHEYSDAAAALTEAIGRPARIYSNVGADAEEALDITRANAYARLLDFDGESTHESFVVQFPEPKQAEALDASVVRDAAGDLLVDGDLGVVRTDGRTIRLDQTAPTAEFGADIDRLPAPTVTWTVEYEEIAAKLTVEHAAGDPVDADRLTLETVGGDLYDRQFADEYETVTPGDSVTLFTDESLQISWRGTGGSLIRRFEP
ncbi:hypothetical protein SAMN06269185_3101 [Natronoarchaeum philippinense]|uniref:Uncharacterized protein n=1 Tax=Natronoarchaeum philippinense TaxID=558529 RepID=A0A285P8Y8_NATPI|nr:hypothetical protein [Natronoarchaeum philippinense]SNZ17717.1 hypothetical protein SAMN06269185_3101 [Natronoarchaeum philippinense]